MLGRWAGSSSLPAHVVVGGLLCCRSEVPAYLELLRRAAAAGVHPQVGRLARCLTGPQLPTPARSPVLHCLGKLRLRRPPGCLKAAQNPRTPRLPPQCPYFCPALSLLLQLLLVDGFGVLHPRRCGSASHLGVLTGLPTGRAAAPSGC